jgi:hypothetical protein
MPLLSNLGLACLSRPKLIIIKIIDFTLGITSMFFSIIIKFIANLIIFMILIIILNLSKLSFYSF